MDTNCRACELVACHVVRKHEIIVDEEEAPETRPDQHGCQLGAYRAATDYARAGSC